MPSSVESIPTPMTRSIPRAPEPRRSTSASTNSRPAAGPNARSISAMSRQRASDSTSAALRPSSSAATMSARCCPAAMCRVGVKNDSRWTTPWAAPSIRLSYANRAQSSLVTRVDCPSQKTRRKPSRESYRYSSSRSVVGRVMPFRRASSMRVRGRSVPSMWQCNSTLGRASRAASSEFMTLRPSARSQ